MQVIDIDKIGHESHRDFGVRTKLKKYFGDEIFDADGSVNRKALGKIVFSDKSKMQLLYDATYTYMVERIDSMISDSQITVLDYALLPLTKYFERCDVKILVEASFDARNQRVIARDNISKEKYESRDANSVDYTVYDFDYTIQNNSDLQYLRKVVGEIYEKSIVSGEL